MIIIFKNLSSRCRIQIPIQNPNFDTRIHCIYCIQKYENHWYLKNECTSEKRLYSQCKNMFFHSCTELGAENHVFICIKTLRTKMSLFEETACLPQNLQKKIPNYHFRIQLVKLHSKSYYVCWKTTFARRENAMKKVGGGDWPFDFIV